ncbi:MAG: hypothetical protein LUG88_07925, partial [Clostridia bacterium]|nr:hypothetical protein [Clostridia bacterium]
MIEKMKRNYSIYIDGYIMPVSPDLISVKTVGAVDEEMLVEGGYVSSIGSGEPETMTVKLEIPDSAEDFDFIDAPPPSGYLGFIAGLYEKTVTVAAVACCDGGRAGDIVLEGGVESGVVERPVRGVEVWLKLRGVGGGAG